MPCTYCSNPKHARKQCEEMDNDFETYLNVSTMVREHYVRELTKKGITPNAIVKTYNRDGDMTNKLSETRVLSLGSVDMFNCYIKVGNRLSCVGHPNKCIILDDNNEEMIMMSHVIEVVEESDQDWTATWVTTPVLNKNQFMEMFKGKKRHVAFEKTLPFCVVKKHTEGVESIEQMVERLEREAAQEAERLNSLDTSNKVYVVTYTSHSDDYKHKVTTVESMTATSYEDAESIAAHLMLERAQDYDLFYDEQDTLESFAKCVSESNESNLAHNIYNFFLDFETLFAGEYVPCTFEVSITEQQAFSVPFNTLRSMSDTLVEMLEE